MHADDDQKSSEYIGITVITQGYQEAVLEFKQELGRFQMQTNTVTENYQGLYHHKNLLSQKSSHSQLLHKRILYWFLELSDNLPLGSIRFASFFKESFCKLQLINLKFRGQFHQDMRLMHFKGCEKHLMSLDFTI
ncbi:unnamed protein product [Paramecium octaurelia]|uniref:Uncharacterized protein n=1 Tax=Paramecium octaurelia TaxID=43137 RepID=A0A8S1YIH3_PAROT|nr:unnamed protein product [Paramecium octaurelia]